MTMDNRQKRIAIFDSGVGGLTVLRELYRQLPNESVLYFGDTAHLPYGTRSKEEILQFVRPIILWAMQQDAKMVLMACNTSSALALETVQDEFDIPMQLKALIKTFIQSYTLVNRCNKIWGRMSLVDLEPNKLGAEKA